MSAHPPTQPADNDIALSKQINKSLVNCKLPFCHFTDRGQVGARMASIAPRLFGRTFLASPKPLACSLQHSRAMHFTYVPDAQAPVDGEQNSYNISLYSFMYNYMRHEYAPCTFLPMVKPSGQLIIQYKSVIARTAGLEKISGISDSFYTAL